MAYGTPPAPSVHVTSTLRIRLTAGCSQSCEHCPDSALYRASVRSMPLEVLETSLQGLFADRFDPKQTQIILSGGEPLEHPSFLEALDRVRRYPVARVKLATNGLRLVSDPAFAAQVLPSVDDLLLSADLAPSGFRPFRSPQHLGAVEELVGRLRAKPIHERPRLALNVVIFDARIERVKLELARLSQLGPDEMRLNRFDPGGVVEQFAASIRVPSDESWAALRAWVKSHAGKSEQGCRWTCVDRQRSLRAGSSHSVELCA